MKAAICVLLLSCAIAYTSASTCYQLGVKSGSCSNLGVAPRLVAPNGADGKHGQTGARGPPGIKGVPGTNCKPGVCSKVSKAEYDALNAEVAALKKLFSKCLKKRQLYLQPYLQAAIKKG
eukprot:319676_1